KGRGFGGEQADSQFHTVVTGLSLRAIGGTRRRISLFDAALFHRTYGHIAGHRLYWRRRCRGVVAFVAARVSLGRAWPVRGRARTQSVRSAFPSALTFPPGRTAIPSSPVFRCARMALPRVALVPIKKGPFRGTA